MGAIYLDQAVHTNAGGYEDATCIAKAGEVQTSTYQVSGKYGGDDYVPCCDYPVMSYSKSQSTSSDASGVKLVMRARACSIEKPCPAFYDWLRSDSATTQSTDKQNSSITFPCKINTAKIDKNYQSVAFCPPSVAIGPLLAGAGWCGVVSSSAEYPTLRDVDDRNQRLLPLWIGLIVAAPIVSIGCFLANLDWKRSKPQPLTTSQHNPAPESAPPCIPAQLQITSMPADAAATGQLALIEAV
jgi:hypothetical protein